MSSLNLFSDKLKVKGNYNFLGCTDLEKRIDTFLELGMESVLEDDLTLLNENKLQEMKKNTSTLAHKNSTKNICDILLN